MIGLQQYIIDNNVNVYKLADEVKVSANTVYNWIRNEYIPKNNLIKLAEVLYTDVEYLNNKINDIRPDSTHKFVTNEYITDGNITKIIITNTRGQIFVVLIDTEDLVKAKRYTWTVNWNNTQKRYYVMNWQYIGIVNGKVKGKATLLHRYLMNAASKTRVDHKDYNTLDNRKYNLRVTTQDKNLKNRSGKNSNNKSGYRNVFWNSNRGMWQVSLCKNYKHILIGFYDNVDEAGKIAEEARRKLYGEFAGKD